MKIRNKSTFETVQKYIINNFGATTSLKSLKKAIEQTGTPISEATIARYIKALLDAKILYVSVGMIGKLEYDFILRDNEMRYSHVQVAYTIALSKDTEDREYRPLESIKDNYPKYIATADSLLQRRNGFATYS